MSIRFDHGMGPAPEVRDGIRWRATYKRRPYGSGNFPPGYRVETDPENPNVLRLVGPSGDLNIPGSRGEYATLKELAWKLAGVQNG